MKRKIITIIAGLLMVLGMFGAPAIASAPTTNHQSAAMEKLDHTVFHGMVLGAKVTLPQSTVKKYHLIVSTGYRILNTQQIGDCVDAASQDYDNNGDPLQTYTCSSAAEQLFNAVTMTGSLSGFVQYQNVSGKCIDADSSTYPKNGTLLQLYTCENTPEQAWTEVYPDAPNASQENPGNNANDFMDADSTTFPANTTIMQLWLQNNVAEQDWNCNSPS